MFYCFERQILDSKAPNVGLYGEHVLQQFTSPLFPKETKRTSTCRRRFMPVYATCHEYVQRTDFSNGQLKNLSYSRCCKQCTRAADQGMTVAKRVNEHQGVQSHTEIRKKFRTNQMLTVKSIQIWGDNEVQWEFQWMEFKHATHRTTQHCFT